VTVLATDAEGEREPTHLLDEGVAWNILGEVPEILKLFRDLSRDADQWNEQREQRASREWTKRSGIHVASLAAVGVARAR
jgi:hypothetical protein